MNDRAQVCVPDFNFILKKIKNIKRTCRQELSLVKGLRSPRLVSKEKMMFANNKYSSGLIQQIHFREMPQSQDHQF